MTVRRWWSAVHGKVPCKVASEKIRTSPASSAGCCTYWASSSSARSASAGGIGKFDLCEPGTAQKPPAPAGAVSKVVVVSQFTAMLDLVERPLTSESIRFLRLDGTLSQAARAEVLRKFSSEKTARVLLLSLRAGGVGLNLTAAQTLYMLE